MSAPVWAIRNAAALLPDGLVEDAVVVFDPGGILASGRSQEVAIPPNTVVVDGEGGLLSPGLIELQINGAFGCDFTADPATIWEVGRLLPRHGVTTFLPTIISSPHETVARARRVLEMGPPVGWVGADPIGLHLEGPFLNPAKAGVHNPRHLAPPALSVAATWGRDTGVRLVTLAPELPGALDLVRSLVARGVLVGAGHSLASADEARAGIEAGIRYATHLFNAMPPLGHREPGLVGAVLADERVTVGLIPDGLHVHPDVVRIVWRTKGSNNVSLVTDAIAGMEMPPGRHVIGDVEFEVEGREARAVGGMLAGSLLTLDEGVRHCAAIVGAPIHHVLHSVTDVPSRLLSVVDRGRLTPGTRADLVLLNRSGQPRVTFIAGRAVWHAPGVVLPGDDRA